MDKFEYKTESHIFDELHEQDKHLNEMGENGWELIYMISRFSDNVGRFGIRKHYCYHVFKRRT